jgi:mannose-6-phosphate isomerase-like protein (cupin superfamily)
MENIRLQFVFLIIFLLQVTCTIAQDQTQKTSPGKDKYTFENCINRFDTTKIIRTSAGYQYWFIPQKFLEDGLTVKMSVAGPHQATHAPHQHPGDEIFFILEGTASFYLNGKTTTGEAYSSFYCPEGSTHGISNAGDTELKYLVIRKYPAD